MSNSFVFGQCDGNNAFVGSVSDQWNDPDNWTSGCVPTSPVIGQITIVSNCAGNNIDLVFNQGSRFQVNDGVEFSNNGGVFTINGYLSGFGTINSEIVLSGEVNPGELSTLIDFDCGNSIDYEGQSYSTVYLGGNCWFLENLNVGDMINGSSEQTNNGIIEKYCYSNNPMNCDIYGGLYQWNELMEYNGLEYEQGICPDGWHIPSDDDYKDLELDLGMSASVVNNTGFRGSPVGSKMASNEILWNDGALEQHLEFGNSGYDALPAGNRNSSGGFVTLGNDAIFWTSKRVNSFGPYAYYRSLFYASPAVSRNVAFKTLGASVRCVLNK